MDRSYSISYFSFFLFSLPLRFASFQFNFASNSNYLFSMRKKRGKSNFFAPKGNDFRFHFASFASEPKTSAHPTSQ